MNFALTVTVRWLAPRSVEEHLIYLMSRLI